MLSAKKFISLTLVSILLSLSCLALFNFAMDPLWTFEHSHKYNQFQRGRKERQQKSNAIYFRSPRYDTILFGSSRISYMNQYAWDDRTYNYSVSDMQPNEYKEYLNFAIDKAKQPIKRVIIGLDLFGALTYAPFISKEPKIILDEISKDFYRYKLLTSVDALDYSIKNIKYTMDKATQKYRYDNRKTAPIKTEKSLESFNKNNESSIHNYFLHRYSKPYDKEYKKIIQALKTSYPDIEFIVFSTPVTAKHFEVIVDNDVLYKKYELWLRESVAVFGELNHFMYRSELSQKANIYFFDSNHGYDTTYECITDEILNKKSSCPQTKIVINKDNIDQMLQMIKKLNLE